MDSFKLTGVIFFLLTILQAAGAAANPGPVLKVGVVPSPPYAMKNLQGEWEGISVDLWRNVTAKLGITCEYQERTYAGLVKCIAEGTLDAGVGRISPLELYDSMIDFTHAFFFSGLAVAVPKPTEMQHWLGVLRMLRESNFIPLVLMIFITIFLAAVTIWFLEHKHNPGHFAHNLMKGIGSGLWWSATTITTIGYGDKVPVTFWGRFLAFFWMSLGILLVAIFTATITSMSTVGRLNAPRYENLSDLQHKRIVAVANSPGDTFVQKTGLDCKKAGSTPEALRLLVNGGADVVIDDQATLKYYYRRQKITGAHILPNLLTLEGYSFVLIKNSPLRNQLNQAIKEYISLPEWQNILIKYLGN